MQIRAQHIIAALTGLSLCAAVAIARAQTSATPPPAASAPRFALPGSMPWQTRADLPVIPHEKQTDVRPYPEYVAEALKLTQLVPDERFKAIRLRTDQGKAPRYLVLPIQTEAFGFTPAFRALIAAHLDHELTARRIDGNRQTDVVDAYGPFARRFDDAALSDLAKEHSASTLLALYLGHDGADRAFLTLVLKDGSRTQRAHREVALPDIPREAAKSLAALLPGMVSQLGLGLAPSPAVATTAKACTMQTWQLERPPADDPTALACHAIVVGTLMPEFERRSFYPSPYTPAKLAWLATAFVEASEFATKDATSRSIQDLAWSQLQFDDAPARAPDHAQSPDPVVARLAKLLSAQRRSYTSPVRSVRDATQRYVEDASQDLPAFTQAVFVERGNYGEAFRQVDLCAIERVMPGAMASSKCRIEQMSSTPSSRSATASETALFQEWRLASYQKDIYYYGTTLGQAERFNQLLASLPNDVARHPIIRRQRFAVEKLDSFQGGFDAYLDRVRTAATAFAQSTADIQRYDTAAASHALSEHSWVQNTNVLNDKTISQLTDDELRLLAVLKYDRFGSIVIPASRRKSGAPAAFLASGSARMAVNQERFQAAMPGASAPQIQRPTASPMQPASAPARVFEPTATAAPQPITETQRQERIATYPTDMDGRVALAMLSLKAGKPEADATRVIDAYPTNTRLDEQVRESHVWALPAHAFFFASDMGNAKRYYQRVRDIGTGSESDLHSRVRLRQIDGDIAGALAATDARLKRYESDFTRRDLAALLFMTGQSERAWQALTPRLLSAKTFQLWTAALVGQRIDHMGLSGAKDWIDRQGLRNAQINYQDSATMYLHLSGVVDRIPTEDDITLMQGSGQNAYANTRWVASAKLMQLSLQEDAASTSFDAARKLLVQSSYAQTGFMKPLFAWVAWHATAGKEPELEAIRQTSLNATDFDALLAKSMLLALEGKTAESLQFMRAARYQMSELGLGSPNVDRPVPSPYQYALAGYLMFRKTGDKAYEAETLRFARAHQQMFPFWGWAYALQALLDRDDKSRAVAICRARYLDAASYFLSQVKPVAKANGPACGKKPWSPSL